MQPAHLGIAIAALMNIGATVSTSEQTFEDWNLVARSGDHRSDVALELHRIDRRYVLTASCAGCLISVSIEDWLHADDPKARRTRDDLDQEPLVASASGTKDQVFFSLLAERPGIARDEVFAFDVVALLESTTGQIVERRLAVFGRLDALGNVTPIDWKAWACASGAATCILQNDGRVLLELNLEVKE